MKILMISLGCDKNLVDTENMLGLLSQDGHTFTDDEQEAEAVIVNTCCFIGDAKEESINTILEMAQLKETGNCQVLLVSGCLGQRYRQEILKEIPEVDGIVGTSSYDSISQVLAEAVRCRQDCEPKDKPVRMEATDRLPEQTAEVRRGLGRAVRGGRRLPQRPLLLRQFRQQGEAGGRTAK